MRGEKLQIIEVLSKHVNTFDLTKTLNSTQDNNEATEIFL